MNHLFIINPIAGQYDRTHEFSTEIHEACKARGLSYRIRVSKQAGDCRDYAREAAETGEDVRIYACGGDGTLNEVINGVVGFPNAAVTHFPGGSGNDFVKIFDDPAAFRDLNRLLEPQEAAFDLIACDDHYALNICSMGLDARIGTEVNQYKRLPGVSGSGAYLLSTAVNFCKGIHEHYVVEIDGTAYDARQTLICICNGRWYGGGFNPVPQAEPDDGILDVLLVRDVSRITVAKVISSYKSGKFTEYPDLIRHFEARSVTVRCDKVSPVNLDGELLLRQEAHFRAVPQALRFFYPSGLQYHVGAKTPECVQPV